VQYTTINTLDDDVLFCIFYLYQLDEENGWNDHLGWCKLSHVCRGWRHLVHFSASRLGMYIRCANGTPIVGTLDHLPPLPLFIDYRETTAPITRRDKSAIREALLLRDRVRHLDLHLPPSILHIFLPLVDGPFLMLEYLSISYTNRGDPTLALPKTFLAPNLRHLNLVGIDIPKRLRLLTSTVSLVTLVLTNIRAPGYFLPRLLAARLQSLPQLENFSIGFADPIPRPRAQRELLTNRGATVTLLNLKHLAYHGVSAYLECLVAQIRTPVLEQLNITLFNQIAFDMPHFSQFIHAIEGLRSPIGRVSFGRDMVSVITAYGNTGQNNGRFSIRVICRQMDWQIDCATQICNVLMHTLFGVEKLKLVFHEPTMPTEWQNGEIDGTTWHELLRVFVGVKELHICAALSQELSRALGVDDVGSDPGLLPGLQEIVSEFEGSDAENLFISFIRARQIAGNSVLYPSSQVKARARWACASSSQNPFLRMTTLISNITPADTASSDAPNEISFSKGEVLEIVNKTGKWWQAKKEDGTSGSMWPPFLPILMPVYSYCRVVVPSNYFQIIGRQEPAEFSYSLDSAPHKERALYACMSSQNLFLRMTILFLTIAVADTADPDDPNEISFSKGEVLEVVNKTGKWWQAKKENGTSGSMWPPFLPILMPVYSYLRVVVPSNYFQIIGQQEPAESNYSPDSALHKARALYACMSSRSPFLRMINLVLTIAAADTADPDDPNEISFSKGEILDIIDNSGKWWQAQKEDGTSGST
jgi:hypothetical protein